MILLIRLSAIPSHFSTPLFATIDGVEYKKWLVAACLSSFKFWISVYLGNLLKAHQESVLGTIALVISIAVTIIVGGYIWWEYKTLKSSRLLDHSQLTDLEIGGESDEEEGEEAEEELLNDTSYIDSNSNSKSDKISKTDEMLLSDDEI